MSNRIYFKEESQSVFLDYYQHPSLVNKAINNENKYFPTVIICPGGGYFCISNVEGGPVAKRFVSEGYNAFVLHYSMMSGASFDADAPEKFAPVNDLEAAINYISDNHKQYNVDTENLSVAGFSAGGHLSFRYCLRHVEEQPKIKSLILVYPFMDVKYKNRDDMLETVSQVLFGKSFPEEKDIIAFSNINELKQIDASLIQNLPPIFIYHARNDLMVPIKSTEDLITILTEKNANITTYICDDGEHANPFYDPSWFDKAIGML